METKEEKGAPAFAHLVYDNPSLDILALAQLLTELPIDTEVLFVGHRNVWVPYLLAQLLPHLRFVGFDEDAGAVNLARLSAEGLSLENFGYRTTSFDEMCKRVGWQHPVVVYVPKLHVSRPFDLAHESRLDSALNCIRMVAKGGIFIMSGALARRSIMKHTITQSVLDGLYAGYEQHGLLTSHIQSELAKLNGQTHSELVQFLLTHAGMGYLRSSIAYAPSVPPDLEGTLVSIADGRYDLYQTYHGWCDNFVMCFEEFTGLTKLLHLKIDREVTSTSSCERLRSLWTLFGLDKTLLRSLSATGLIVARKPY